MVDINKFPGLILVIKLLQTIFSLEKSFEAGAPSTKVSFYYNVFVILLFLLKRW